MGVIISGVTVTPERARVPWPRFLILIALIGASAALVAYFTSPGLSPQPTRASSLDARIHVPLFVDPNHVHHTPRFRFTFDTPEALAGLRASERLDDVVTGAAGDFERAMRLMHWARRQWEPGVPNPYPPLDARIILRDIRRGFTGGQSAQYNTILVQALQSLGIPARYVRLVDHDVIEARPGEEARWLCLDPLNDTIFMDETATPLSAYEVHERILSRLPVALSQGHRSEDPAALLRSFASFGIWLKNDHVGSPVNFADLERYIVYFVDQADQPTPFAPGVLTTTDPVDLYAEGRS